MKSLIKSFVISSTDCKTLSIVDTSVYNSEVAVTDSIYRITLPNSTRYIDVVYVPGNITHINSNVLRLTNTLDFENLSCLPDGVYHIRQSICPNDKLFYEFQYLNVCNLYHKIINCACTLMCDDPKLGVLAQLKMDLLIAQDLVNICGNDTQGVTIYNNVDKELSKLCCF